MKPELVCLNSDHSYLSLGTCFNGSQRDGKILLQVLTENGARWSYLNPLGVDLIIPLRTVALFCFTGEIASNKSIPTF